MMPLHTRLRRNLTRLGIGAALLTAIALPSSAHAQDQLIGAYAGTATQAYVPGIHPTLIVDLTVTGYANRLGPFTAVGQQTVDLLTGTYTGSYTFTVASGDTLSAYTTGTRHLLPSGATFSLEEHFTITGGTGVFSGATGEGDGLGAFGTLTNQIAVVFGGTLSTASAFTPSPRR